jgi:transcriptional regulator GlxA family with amidase domain
MSTENIYRASRRDFLMTASAALAALGTRALPAQASDRLAESNPGGARQVAILLYDRMTALDAIGPYEVLRSLPGVRVRFVARHAGLITPDSGLHMLNAEAGLADVTSADVLVVPGGDASGPMRDPAILQWVRDIHETTTWTTSVCLGSMILGAAGLLKGRRATTHWIAMDALPRVGAEPVNERVVRDGKIITAAGVSSGIDMALSLVALTDGEEMARTVQLVIEYDPRPPFDSGAKAKATSTTIERARQIIRDMYS